MTTQEFKRLLRYAYAKNNAPYTDCIAKRHAKGRGKHVGSVLKHSRVIPQVRLERVFIERK